MVIDICLMGQVTLESEKSGDELMCDVNRMYLCLIFNVYGLKVCGGDYKLDLNSMIK